MKATPDDRAERAQSREEEDAASRISGRGQLRAATSAAMSPPSGTAVCRDAECKPSLARPRTSA